MCSPHYVFKASINNIISKKEFRLLNRIRFLNALSYSIITKNKLKRITSSTVSDEYTACDRIAETTIL